MKQPKTIKFSELPAPKTVAELRARLDARRPYAQAVADAMARGDLEACAAAQKAFRDAFPN